MTPRKAHFRHTRARYSRFVGWSKWTLWGLAGVIIASIFWISSGGGDGAPRVVFSGIKKSENVSPVMLKPHYQGVDSRNQPYTVTAASARQIDSNTVAMEQVTADMVTGRGASWLALRAGSGTLTVNDKKLELSDRVYLFYQGGYEFRTAHAHVDIKEGSAYGDTSVEGQGPLGTLTADAFHISEHANVIKFNGSVRMILYP